MKQASALMWSVLAVALVLIVVGSLWWAARARGLTDPSIVLDKRGAPSPQVENGTAYDWATVKLGGEKKVILPTEATVSRGGEGGTVQLLMAKRLFFAGHPAEAMSIRQTRKRMGCAVRNEGAALVVALYGEWDSGIEGGARVKLVAVVPDGVEVEQRAGLSKPLDAGRAWGGLSLPAEGWTGVTDVPDPERSADR